MKMIILVFCAVLAVAQGQTNDHVDWTATKTDTLFPHWVSINIFESEVENQTGFAKTLDVQYANISAYLTNLEEDLNSLALMNGDNKQCIDTYRTKIPTLSNTNDAMNNCIMQAENAIREYPIYKAYNLAATFYESFYNETKVCREKYLVSANNAEEYYSCISTAVQNNEAADVEKFKTNANIELEATLNKMKEGVKKALDCGDDVENGMGLKTVNAITLINNCILNKLERTAVL